MTQPPFAPKITFATGPHRTTKKIKRATDYELWEQELQGFVKHLMF